MWYSNVLENDVIDEGHQISNFEPQLIFQICTSVEVPLTSFLLALFLLIWADVENHESLRLKFLLLIREHERDAENFTAAMQFGAH